MNDPNSVLAKVQQRLDNLPPDFPEVLIAPIGDVEMNFWLEPESAVDGWNSSVMEVRFHDHDLPEVVRIPDEVNQQNKVPFLRAVLDKSHADSVSTACVSTDTKLRLTVIDTRNCWELSCPIIWVAGSFLLGDWRIDHHQQVEEDE
jgi:hypothetical protein